MEKHFKPICYGSLLTLKTVDSYYLCAQGFIDNSPYLLKQMNHSFSRAIFRIIPSSMYAVQKELLGYVEEIKDYGFIEKASKLTKLEDNLEGEIKTNMQHYNSLRGKPVKYDSLIQLEHVQSHKFLTLEPNETAEVEKENLKVSLQDFPNEYTHFRITPGYNYQKFSDGIVKSLDKVHFEIMITNLRKIAFLHCSHSPHSDTFNQFFALNSQQVKEFFEVNISLDQKTKWVVSEFSESTKDDDHLVCGDYVWMVKPEDSISLTVSKKKTNNTNNLMFTQNSSDTNGLWRVEHQDPSIGGLLEISGQYRLRHISTDHYLAIDYDLTPCLMEYPGDGTLWNIIPLEPESTNIKIDEMCLVINTSTQRTISTSAQNYQLSTVPCIMTGTSIDEDSVFKITRAGREVVWETFFLLHCYPILQSFSAFIVQDIVLIGPDGFKAIHEFKKKAELIETCISKLIQFCNNKLEGMIGIDNHYGEVQLIRQRMLREQYFFEILANILDLAFKEPIDYDKILRVSREKEKTQKKDSKSLIDLELVRLKNVVKIIEKIYSLLMTLCHKNHENQVYAYKFFPVFMKHIGLGVGASKFMMSVLNDNEQLMLSINNVNSIEKGIDLIEYFVEILLPLKNEMRVKILDFFKSICVFKGQGVTANQEKVFNCLFKNPSIAAEALTPTCVEKNTLYIIIDSRKMAIESCFENGRPSVYYDDVIYFTKLLELYANMCVGRNFEVSDKLTKQFPFEAIHSLMWNSEISDELRAAFCKMVLNLYVDCAPRELISKPHLVKEFKDVEVKNGELNPHMDTLSLDYKRKGDFVKVCDSSGESLILCQAKENAVDSFPLSMEDAQIYKLLENIFDYFENGENFPEFTCEILRMCNRLIKFELLGICSTDFENERIIQNPQFMQNELDIVRILKPIIGLLSTETRKNTFYSMGKRRRSTKLDSTVTLKTNPKTQYVVLATLLQDTGNINDPLIRSAANLKNYITAYKLNPLNCIEIKKIDNRIKLKVTRMLHYYLDTRQDFFINNFVAWFNGIEERRTTAEEMINLLPPVMKFAINHEPFKLFLGNLFNTSFLCVKGPFIPDLNSLVSGQNDKRKDYSFRVDMDKPEHQDTSSYLLLPQLFKAFVYCENYKLQSSLLSLIIRSYEQRKELLKNLSILHPISNAQDIELFYWLKLNVKTFKTFSEQSELWITYWRHDDQDKKRHFESFQTILSILKNLESVMYADTFIEGGTLRTEIKGNLRNISPSRQKLMNYLGVDKLILALIKDGIHELVNLYVENKGKKHRENLTSLFKLCFSFLTKYAVNNPQNQKKLHKNLHIFLQNLNIQLGQIDLICEIFKNNLKLIDKLDHDFVNIFRDLIIKYGRKPLFLQFLKVIQVANSKPVPAMQRIILNMFIKEDLDVFLLYMDDQKSPEFTFEKIQTDNPEYDDEPYTYHAALLEVLSQCGFGVKGMYFNEAKCQNIVKLNNIFNILFKAEDANTPYYALKIPMIDFFFNIYLDCEIMNLELKTCKNFFKYIKKQSKVLEETEKFTQDYTEFIQIFIKVLQKYRQSYIKKKDNFFYDNKDSKAIVIFLESLIKNLKKIDTLGLPEIFVHISTELCNSFGLDIKFTIEEEDVVFEENITFRRVPSNLLKSKNTVVLSAWDKVRETLMYDNAFKAKLQEEEQAFLVAIHFSSELMDDISFERIIRTMVNFIRLSRSQQPPISLTISAINLLARILANPVHDKYTEKSQAKRYLQNCMMSYGLVRVAFALMCDTSVDIEIFKALISICIELLDGGNESVQNEIHTYFNNTPNSEIFFERVNQMFNDYIDRFVHGQILVAKRTKIFRNKTQDIRSLLRLLQLFCEGHNSALQNYIRVQHNSRNSYNMISNIISLLEVLVEKKYLISFLVMSQCFDTLTEFIQGPCIRNQEIIIDGMFLELASNLLSLDEKSNTAEKYKCVKKNENLDTNSDIVNVEEEEVFLLTGWMIAHLKYKCMITILSLLEGRNDNYVVTRLIRAFNIEILKENMKSIFVNYVEFYGPSYYDNDIFDHIRDNESYIFGANENVQDNETKFYSLVVETGFMIYHLLKIFMDNDDPESQEILANELEEMRRFREEEDNNYLTLRLIKIPEINSELIKENIKIYKYYTRENEFEASKEIVLGSTFRFFDKFTGKIEIVFNGNLFPVYFSLPAEFRGLTPEIKENFHRRVNRDTDQAKLKYLLKHADEYIEQIRHEHFLLNMMQNNRFVSLIASKVYIWRDIAFALTLLLNLCVLLSFSVYNGQNRMDDVSLFNLRYKDEHLAVTDTDAIMKALGIVQLICCLIIVAFFLLKVGPIVARRGWKKHKPTIAFLKSNPNLLMMFLLKSKQIIFTVFYVLIDFHVLYHIAYTIFSVQGIFTHPFYFSLLLLDILYKYPSLQNVVKSFIVPRKALLLTFCMMIIFMYIFAIIGYMYFQDDFDNSCKTLYWCTIILWDASFKNSGKIGGFMRQFDDGDYHAARFFYDNIFYILLDVIIIGVVEGLIIDTFAMLREDQEQSSTDRENKCFICGLERDFIERKTTMPFSRHTELEHNEWNYMLFIAYLKRKDETEYTGLESYVKTQVDKGEINWIPNLKALSIRDITLTQESQTLQNIDLVNERLRKLETQILEIKIKQSAK